MSIKDFEFKKMHVPWNKGKKGLQAHSEETKKKMKEAAILRCKLCPRSGSWGNPFRAGKNNLNWAEGKSFEEYPKDWTKTLRLSIRQRDKFRCRVCGKKEDDIPLPVHHIDYDKQNCNPNNLITLCSRCHTKTNYNRSSWKKYFLDLCLV